MLMIPEHTSVKIDKPTSEWHGETGYILYNHRSGIIEPCDNCDTKKECKKNNCEDGFILPKNWYALVFDPMKSGGFRHCKEYFKEENIVIRGC